MGDLLKPQRVKTTQLDAWPVVSSLLFDFTQASDDIVSIVGRAGLNVDWNLNPKESYSHSTRKRAYRPRVHTAYSELSHEDRATALSLVVAELARRFPVHGEAIKTALAHVGWTLKAVSESESGVTMKRIKELQKLLLLQVRDGQEPPGLTQYSEQEQVYNSALLINDGYVDGQAIQNGSGIVVSTVMLQLTSKGHDYLEETDMPPKPSITPKSKNGAKKIFVSHSSADEDLAEALLDLLCTALPLRRADFLCTSVDGAKLRGGDDTDEVLRREIRDVPAFLSLLTKKAVASTYVLFELGARWGCERHHIPLLAKGAGTEVLKEPLKATNALLLSNEADVLQLVEDLAHVLNLEAEPPNSYLKKARKIVDVSRAQVATGGTPETSLLGQQQRIEQLAKTRLIQCVDLLKNMRDFQQALNLIQHIQKSWNSENEQVCVVANDRFAMHPDSRTQTLPPAVCWPDELSGSQPLYPFMKSQRNGLKFARIHGTKNRLTAIAFESIDSPTCLVVAEAHYHEVI